MNSPDTHQGADRAPASRGATAVAHGHTIVDTALGELTLVVRDDALAGLYFEGHWHLPKASALGERVASDAHPLFAQVTDELDEYLTGGRREFTVPVVTNGSAFSERVWAMLRDIPFGATATYGALAELLGSRTLARRVGQSVGANPVSIFIPCHRMVGANGSLTGFAGGLERKRLLLETEGGVVSEKLTLLRAGASTQ